MEKKKKRRKIWKWYRVSNKLVCNQTQHNFSIHLATNDFAKGLKYGFAVFLRAVSHPSTRAADCTTCHKVKQTNWLVAGMFWHKTVARWGLGKVLPQGDVGGLQKPEQCLPRKTMCTRSQLPPRHRHTDQGDSLCRDIFSTLLQVSEDKLDELKMVQFSRTLQYMHNGS